jgi:translation initiation factor 1
MAGLPQNLAFLKDLCRDLKRACGTGGTVVDHGVELQGDLRDRVREALLKKGFIGNSPPTIRTKF